MVNQDNMNRVSEVILDQNTMVYVSVTGMHNMLTLAIEDLTGLTVSPVEAITSCATPLMKY